MPKKLPDTSAAFAGMPEESVEIRVPLPILPAIETLLEEFRNADRALLRPSGQPLPHETPLIDDKVRAGFPSPVSGDASRQLDLNEYLIQNRAATFFLTVSGDSMIGEGICDGDMVIVDRSIEPRSGAIVVAAIEGDFTLKRLVIRGASFELHSGNPAYPTLHPKREEDCVVGVVRWIIRKCSR